MRNEDESSLEGDVTVRGSGSAFVQTIDTRTHRVTADEPIARGGTDAGPTPYELILAALGS
jgi:putative redox protein